MKITKKLISLALAAMLLLGLAAPAMAADSDFVIDWRDYWDFGISGNCLLEYQGPGGVVVIPDGVVMVSDSAFYGCTTLTSVTFSSSVTAIGDCAFERCTGLTSVTFPSGVTFISGRAFAECTSLTSVTIPSSVTNIWSNAFSGCTSLTDIYFGGTQEQWKGIEDYLTNLSLSIFGEGVNPTIHYNSTGPDSSTTPTTSTPEPAASGNAMPTNDQLTVNGALQSPTVYKIDGNNYFKIRDLAAVLNGTEKQFNVGYDSALKSVTVTTGKGYAKLDTDLAGAAAGGSQTAVPSNDSIYIDGQKIDVTVYKIGGNNYFKLRDLGQTLDFYVGWTLEDGVFIDTSKPYSD